MILCTCFILFIRYDALQLLAQELADVSMKLEISKWVTRITYFSTKGTSVLGVLCNFDLLHHLTKRGSITGTVFTYDSYFFRSFRLITSNGTECKY